MHVFAQSSMLSDANLSVEMQSSLKQPVVLPKRVASMKTAYIPAPRRMTSLSTQSGYSGGAHSAEPATAPTNVSRPPLLTRSQILVSPSSSPNVQCLHSSICAHKVAHSASETATNLSL